MFSDREYTPSFSGGTGMAHPGKGDYSVRYRINIPAKAVYVTWVGSADDIKREIEEKEQRHPGSTHVKKTVRILNVPSRKELSQPLPVNRTNEHNALFTIPANQQEVKDDDGLDHLYDEHSFKTDAQYLAGLERTGSIFEAMPGTPEFNELLTLLPLVKRHEDYRLKFPQLHPYEIVKHKMMILDMIPSYLTSVVNDKEELQQFLARRLVLSSDVLQTLYNFLHIRIPVNDMRFLH
jgi:hypothetical protein